MGAITLVFLRPVKAGFPHLPLASWVLGFKPIYQTIRPVCFSFGLLVLETRCQTFPVVAIGSAIKSPCRYYNQVTQMV